MFHLLAEATSTGSGSEALLIGGVVALSSALTEAVKALAARRKNGKNGAQDPGEARESIVCQGRVKAIYEVVSRTDEQGMPLVYGHRAVCEKLDQIIAELRGQRD